MSLIESAKNMMTGFSERQLRVTAQVGLTQSFKDAAKILLKEKYNKEV